MRNLLWRLKRLKKRTCLLIYKQSFLSFSHWNLPAYVQILKHSTMLFKLRFSCSQIIWKRTKKCENNKTGICLNFHTCLMLNVNKSPFYQSEPMKVFNTVLSPVKGASQEKKDRDRGNFVDHNNWLNIGQIL